MMHRSAIASLRRRPGFASRSTYRSPLGPSYAGRRLSSSRSSFPTSASLVLCRVDMKSSQVASSLVERVGDVLQGKEEVVRLVVVALLARGHVLVEDVPGVGKTTLARALAASLGLSFRRLQFTSDLMPADVLGGNVFDREKFDIKLQMKRSSKH